MGVLTREECCNIHIEACKAFTALLLTVDASNSNPDEEKDIAYICGHSAAMLTISTNLVRYCKEILGK